MLLHFELKFSDVQISTPPETLLGRVVGLKIFLFCVCLGCCDTLLTGWCRDRLSSVLRRHSIHSWVPDVRTYCYVTESVEAPPPHKDKGVTLMVPVVCLTDFVRSSLVGGGSRRRGRDRVQRYQWLRTGEGPSLGDGGQRRPTVAVSRSYSVRVLVPLPLSLLTYASPEE